RGDRGESRPAALHDPARPGHRGADRPAAGGAERLRPGPGIHHLPAPAALIGPTGVPPQRIPDHLPRHAVAHRAPVPVPGGGPARTRTVARHRTGAVGAPSAGGRYRPALHTGHDHSHGAARGRRPGARHAHRSSRVRPPCPAHRRTRTVDGKRRGPRCAHRARCVWRNLPEPHAATRTRRTGPGWPCPGCPGWPGPGCPGPGWPGRPGPGRPGRPGRPAPGFARATGGIRAAHHHRTTRSRQPCGPTGTRRRRRGFIRHPVPEVTIESVSTPPGRLGLGVVGAGRVGAVLASALRSSGHAVVGVSATSQESRDRAEALLPAVPVLEVQQVVERSELVLLTVPDDVLGELVEGLATLGAFQPGQLVVHTAGRFGVDVLAPARAAGAIPLAIHPAMTFTGTSVDLSRLVGAPFAVTADAPVLPIAQALVVEIGGEPIPLAESSRGLYHAALAHGGNHLVTLTTQASRVLAAAGVEDGGTLLRPLLTAALDGALRGGEVGLTGPVVRGDAGTVGEHLEVLSTAAAADPGLSDVVAGYRTMARATVQRALSNQRIGEAQAAALLD